MTIRKDYAGTPAGQIHYRHVPGPAACTPLVFLHRTPASSATFEPMMTAMTGDRPLCAFDTPGFGGSFDPVGFPVITDYRDWLAAAIDDAGIDRFHIYGHHTGTHIATELAALWPDRVQSLMLNGMAYLTDAEREAFKSMVGPAQAPDPEGAYLAPLWTLIRSLFPVWDPELVHREFIGALRSSRGRDQGFRAIWDQDFVAVLKRVRCPLLAVSASDDFFLPFLERVKSSHPLARTVVQNSAKVASPELDTAMSVRVVRDFIADVESGKLASSVS